MVYLVATCVCLCGFTWLCVHVCVCALQSKQGPVSAAPETGARVQTQFWLLRAGRLQRRLESTSCATLVLIRRWACPAPLHKASYKNVIQHRANVISHSLYCKFNSVFEVATFDLNLISSGSHNLNVNGWYETRKAINTACVCVPSGKVNHAISFIKVANDAFGHTLQLLKNLLKIILTKTKG